MESRGDDVLLWMPRSLGKAVELGASGPVPTGAPAEITNGMELWMEIADLDSFNVGHITNPGTWEDVVELLVPELRARGQVRDHDREGLWARKDEATWKSCGFQA